MNAQNLKKQIHDKGLETPDDSGEDDVVDEIKICKKNIKKQRESISAEVYGQWNKKENFKPQVVKKSKEMEQRIFAKLNQAFMFNALNQQDKEIVMLAMEEKKFPKDSWVIKQGEEGDVLYVIDQGQLDCFKQYPDEQQPTYLKTYQPGESFGELALLYNAPRAASIQAKTDSILFSLDRQTFNHIVKDASMKKRQQYEDILTKWELLSFISDPYEKTKIADILVESSHNNNEVIVKKNSQEGDIYLVIEGQVGVKHNGNTEFTIDVNDYFGEVPIIFNKPQPVEYVALKDNTKLLQIPRSSYDSCLKVAQSQISQHAQKFQKYL